MTEFPDDATALRFSGVFRDSGAGAAIARRAAVMAMTHQAEEAVLKPADCGRWPRSLRAALASRMARQHRLDDLADHYAAQVENPAHEPIADPEESGQAQSLASVVRFMDRVALQPRNVIEQDIVELKSAGVSDADIVRLTELNAFLAYQLRLVSGLKLLGGDTT